MSENLSVPERLWCSYPDCPCDREHNGVCQYKHPTFSCDVCGEQKPMEEKHHGFPYGVEATWCNSCQDSVEAYDEYPRKGDGGGI